MSLSKLLAASKSMVGVSATHNPYRMRPENLLPKFESKKNPFASVTRAEASKTETAPATMEPAAISSAPKVATMETYPLFDTALNPVVACAAAAARSTPEVAAITGNAEAPASAVAASPDGARSVVVASADANSVFEQRRLPHQEANIGLMDAHPLGLKTGSDSDELPEPVYAPVKSKPSEQPAAQGEKAAAAPAHEYKRVVLRSEPGANKTGWFAKLLNRLPFGKRPQPAARRAVQVELSLDRVKVVRNDLNDADLEVVQVKAAPVRLKDKPEVGGLKLKDNLEAAGLKLKDNQEVADLKLKDKPMVTGLKLRPLADGETGGLNRLSRILGAGQSVLR